MSRRPNKSHAKNNRPALAALLTNAKQLLAQQHYVPAAELLQQGLAHHAATASPEQLAELNYLYGDTLQQQGNSQAAIAQFETVLTLDSQHLLARRQLINLLIVSSQYQVALPHIEISLKQAPDTLNALIQKAHILTALHNYTEAAEIWEKLTSTRSDLANFWNNAGNAWQSLGQLDKATHYFNKALACSDSQSFNFSNLLVNFHYHPDYNAIDIFNVATEWQQRYAKDVTPYTDYQNTLQKNKKLRIGMFSDGFRTHPVGQMITSALEQLPAHEIELYLYSTNNAEDVITHQLKAIAQYWLPISHLDDHAFAEQVRRDNIDILFDLCGHNNGSRMQTMLMKPAPVQVKWVGGLINTTGVPAIDYLLSDHIETPAGVDALYVEKLIRMPDDYICYNPPLYTPDVAALPASNNGYLTLGCFNNPTKINAVLLKQWAAILHTLPQAQLFLKGLQFGSELLKNQVRDTLAEHGITADRVIIEGPSSHNELLRTYNKIDIALDPWPYSGGLTTCEALFMGVPVVTLPGPTFAGRHSATHLTNVGLSQLVAEDWQHYHDIVVNLASDLDNLANIRNHLRSALLESPVCDAPRFARNFSNAMRAIWQRHCAGKAPIALSLDKEGNAQFADEDKPVELQLPEEPITVTDNNEFRFQFQGKIVVVDNGADFSAAHAFSGLHKLNVLSTICLDPGSQITNSQQLQHIGEFYHYPMMVLGNGQATTLYATIEPKKSSTLKPQAIISESDIIAELPIGTVCLDDVEAIPQLDWLALDFKHNISDAINGAINKIKNAILIQVRINFVTHYESQATLESVIESLATLGFSFYDFKNNTRTKKYTVESELLSKSTYFLTSADAIFIPSADIIKGLDKNKIFKLAFIAHSYLEDHNLCSNILLYADEKLCLAYNKSNVGSTSQKSQDNYNIDLVQTIENKTKNLFNSNLLIEDWKLNDKIKVVDIGANPIDGLPPYYELLQKGLVSLIGFEPQQDALAELNRIKGKNEHYLPYAVGNGEQATLYICQASGMTSTLKPNFKVLDQFQGYPEWAKIKREEKIATVRLDDLDEIEDIDWLKIDIQGGELTVFNNAKEKLKNTLVVQTEVNFIQLYENQPLFAEVDQWMRSHGFILHTLLEERKRLYAPLIINNQIHQGLNQLTTADAVYIKDTTRLELLTKNEKLKMAFILHNAYQSYDITLRILNSIEGFDTNHYIDALKSQPKHQGNNLSNKIDNILSNI